MRQNAKKIQKVAIQVSGHLLVIELVALLLNSAITLQVSAGAWIDWAEKFLIPEAMTGGLIVTHQVWFQFSPKVVQ